MKTVLYLGKLWDGERYRRTFVFRLVYYIGGIGHMREIRIPRRKKF